eukprot:4774739-Alexandrium_andersonii.AAC.1
MVPQQTLAWSNAGVNPILGFSTDHFPLRGVIAFGPRSRKYTTSYRPWPKLYGWRPRGQDAFVAGASDLWDATNAL